MSENSKKPKIRFFGFVDDWEQRKLGELGGTFTGLSGKTKDDFGHGDAEYVTYVNVFSNPIAAGDGTESVEIDEGQNTVQYGDVLFTTSSETPEEVGMSSVWLDNRVNVYLNSFCFGWRPSIKFDPNYLAFMLRSSAMRKKFTFLAQGISRYNISKNKVMEMSVPVPSADEQGCVGAFFTNLDRLITLHQRKYDKTVNIKKTMLEKMFPKDGADRPEIRFKGFSGIWKMGKLSELADFAKGQGYSKSDLKESGDPIILYGRLYTKYETVISEVDSFVLKKEKSVFSKGNEVIVPASGETAEDIARAAVVENTGIILGGDLNILKPNPIIDPIFLALTITNGAQKKELSKRAQGKSVVHLYSSDLKEVPLFYPKLEEQKRISTLFRNFDNILALHQRKLVKLKNLKKAFLEKMFVSI